MVQWAKWVYSFALYFKQTSTSVRHTTNDTGLERRFFSLPFIAKSKITPQLITQRATKISDLRRSWPDDDERWRNKLQSARATSDWNWQESETLRVTLTMFVQKYHKFLRLNSISQKNARLPKNVVQISEKKTKLRQNANFVFTVSAVHELTISLQIRISRFLPTS